MHDVLNMKHLEATLNIRHRLCVSLLSLGNTKVNIQKDSSSVVLFIYFADFNSSLY